MRRISPASNSRRRLSSRRGYTLIEMSVVILILLLMAAVILPNFVAIKRGRDRQDSEAALARLPIEVRSEALRAQEPVSLRVDGNALVAERRPVDNSNPEEFKRVTLDPDIQVSGVQLGKDQTDISSWKWMAYPDGRTDAGSLTITEGATRRKLMLTADGNVQWMPGDYQDNNDETWPAGNLEQRVQTN